MTQPGPNHYEVLGIPANASDDEVRRAYRERAKTSHPDAGGDAATFRQLLDAYQVLCDRDLRRAYDDRMGIRALIEPSSGGAARAGWSGTRGEFSGDVEFPNWMRTITDAVWRPRDEHEETNADAARAASRPMASAAERAHPSAPADVVWWFPETATGPPIVAGPLVVIPVGRRLVAVSAELGLPAWDADLGHLIVGSAGVISDRVVAWTRDGTVHAVDIGRGVTRWARPAGPPGDVGVLATDDEIVVAGTDGRMLALEPSDGRLRWIAKIEGPPSTGLVAGTGAVFCATTHQTLEAIELARGRHRWRLTIRPALTLPPCPVGETVWLAGVAGAGSLVRVTAATGAPAGSFAAGQAVAGLATDGSNLFTSVSGPPRLLAVGDGGQLHLAVTLPHVAPEPALDGRYAYVADPEGAIVVVDQEARAIVRVSSVPFEPLGAPLLAPDRIVVRDRDGRVWATTRAETASPA